MTEQLDPRATATDLDRRLAAFLADDGVSRAPEHPIDGALAHARAHPRRRDVLAAVRPDPMDGYAGALGLARGPAGAAGAGRAAGMIGRAEQRLLLVAGIGLLLAGALAVASVGGMFDPPGIVLPDASPSPVPSVGPSVAPSTSPSLPPVTSIRVDLTERSGSDAYVEVTDESGTVRSAVTGTPGDGGSTDGRSVTATQGRSPNTIVLTWTGMPCEIGHQVLIQPDGRSMTLFRTTCQGDAMPRDLVLELTFAAPVAPADLDITLETVVP